MRVRLLIFIVNFWKNEKEQFLSLLLLHEKAPESCLKIYFFFQINRRDSLLFSNTVRPPGLSYILQVRVAMGAACHNCTQFFTPHKQELQKQPNDDEQMETNRKMTTIALPRNYHLSRGGIPRSASSLSTTKASSFVGMTIHLPFQLHSNTTLWSAGWHSWRKP
jgi:hypothetical protein